MRIEKVLLLLEEQETRESLVITSERFFSAIKYRFTLGAKRGEGKKEG